MKIEDTIDNAQTIRHGTHSLYSAITALSVHIKKAKIENAFIFTPVSGINLYVMIQDKDKGNLVNLFKISTHEVDDTLEEFRENGIPKWYREYKFGVITPASFKNTWPEAQSRHKSILQKIVHEFNTENKFGHVNVDYGRM